MLDFAIESIVGISLVTILIIIGLVIGFIFQKFGFFPDLKNEEYTNKKLGRRLAIAIGIAFIIEACAKIAHFEPMVVRWEQYNMLYMLRTVGISELILGFLLLFPHLYKGAALILTAIMGGAITVHLPTNADGFAASVPSATFLSFLWLSLVLYSPEMFPDFISNLFHKNKKNK